MRVAIVAESFLPNVNGVTNSVLRVLEYLAAHGHQAMVIAPGARDFEDEVASYAGFPIIRVPTIMVPLINSLPIGLPTRTVKRALAEFQPDVVHLASPFVLGGAGAIAARQLGVPAVAIYQTDVAGFAQRYHLSPLATASWEWTRALHNMCMRTLAPSTAAIEALESHGIHDVYRWARGVDAQLFNPERRSPALRQQLDPTGTKILVGYVGRLAAEKGVHRLRALNNDPRIQLVIVGDGPSRPELEEALPTAAFLGSLTGIPLAEAYASLDVFIHPGEYETFCQAVQEALASGVPAIGPAAGGPLDLITPGVDGALLPVSTFTTALPATVDFLYQHRDTMSQAARAATQSRTWDAICDQLMGHYRAAIDDYAALPTTLAERMQRAYQRLATMGRDS